ncbi:MAG: hypothetical protein ACRKGH_00155 [Dehalogenimonas sp.]
MNWPPLLLHLRIPSNSGFVGLWLPWFLLYPVLLGLMLIALPVVIIVALILLPMGKARSLLMAGPYFWRLLFAMRGLTLDIQNGNRVMLVDFV